MSTRPGKDVRGVILAGVHPWEGSAFDRVLPRPLLPLANAPLISYPLRWLLDGGVRDVTICANSASRLVRQCLGDGGRLGARLDYYEDLTPRGPAGCLRDAALDSPAETIVAVDGTLVPHVDLQRLLASHHRSDALVTAVVSQEHRAWRDVEDALSPVGVYVFRRRAFERIGPTGYQDIKEVLIPRLYELGERVIPYRTCEPGLHVFGPTTYLCISEGILERLAADAASPPGYRKVGGNLIHSGARVDAAAVLVPPVLVGAGTRIERRATLVGPTVIGPACRVAAGAVVCRSAVWDRCHLGAGSTVDQSILTGGVAIAAGTRCSRTVHVSVRPVVPVPPAPVLPQPSRASRPVPRPRMPGGRVRPTSASKASRPTGVL